MEFYNDLILIRHAENETNKSLPNNLLALSKKGILQAKEAKQFLKDKFDIVISSPSKRAVMTAQTIANNAKIISDSRLLERGWGNKNQDGKETDEEAKKRFKEFITDILEKYKNKKILLVTHGSLMKLAQDVIENKKISRESVENCTIIIYKKNGKKEIINSSII